MTPSPWQHGVSGTLKVEAYLKQQLKIAESKEDLVESSELEPVGETTKAERSIINKVIPSSSLFRSNAQIQDIPKTSQKEKLFSGPDGNLITDRDEDEDEDTQRFLFEENKFAAPNLLARLGRLLEWLFTKQQELTEGAVGDCDKWANLTSNNPNDSIINSGTSHVDLRALDISIPFHLRQKLKWDFDQLIANTVYTKREWQTTSYRQQATVVNLPEIPEEKLVQDNSGVASGGKNSPIKQDNLPGAKKSRKSLDRQSIVELSTMEKQSNNVGNTEIQLPEEVPNSEFPASLVTLRREASKANVGHQVPRTRIEKYKYLAEKALPVTIEKKRKSCRSSVNQTSLEKDEQETEKTKEIIINAEGLTLTAQHQLPLSSISFSLMSKVCEDYGWITHHSLDQDLERLTLIEWAHSRLQESIVKRMEYAAQAEQKGETGPLIMKKYGESKDNKATEKTKKKSGKGLQLPTDNSLKNIGPIKKGQLESVVFRQYGEGTYNKHKKRKSRIQRTASGTAKLELFLVVLPDETMTLYYPSGKIAVCVANNIIGEGKYIYVYDDTINDSLVAYFTPTDAFCCDRNGKQVLCDPKGGAVYDQEGSVIEKWTWKPVKLRPPISLEFNEYLTLRIMHRSVMILHFNAQQESQKLTFGLSENGNNIHANAEGELQTLPDKQCTEEAQMQETKPKARSKRDERRARANRRQSQQVAQEELKKQRREELDKKFPERTNLALDLPSDIELYKLKRRIKNLAFDWMESYRLLVGISSPIKVSGRHAHRKQTSSAKSVPGALPSRAALRKLDHVISRLDHRAPSAPPIPRDGKFDISKMAPLDRLPAEDSKERGTDWSHEDNPPVSPVYLTEGEKQKFMSGPASPRPPFRCGVVNREPRCKSPKEGCPVALRSEMLGERYAFCRCRKREIPFVSDLEYDIFIRDHVAHTQLLVVSIVVSRHLGDTPGISMLERLYYEKNRNRSFPCAQARHDPFRIVLYDVDSSMNIDEPLLVQRHNVVPGMFLMYIGGKLLFADHIFNGYGNARNDFLKQITKTRKDFLQGLFLPQDFRLSPTPCRSGFRTAWGGEIGGLSKSVCRTESAMSRSIASSEGERLPSAVTSASSESFDFRASGAKSAASFIKLGLSIDSPFGKRVVKSQPSARPIIRKKYSIAAKT